MIWFCLGTSGELIKIYPLIEGCIRKNLEWRVLSTGQSPVNFWRQWDDFGLPRSRTMVLNSSTHDLNSSLQALRWFLKSFLRSRRSLRKLLGKVDSQQDFWIIHGDTLSSLLGATYGKRLGLRILHVESGLSSHSLLEPFPEELCRRWVSRRSSICFAPDKAAADFLRQRQISAKIVDTRGNTLLDAVRLARTRGPAPSTSAEPYAVVNVHRFENLHSASRWQKIRSVLLQAAENTRLLIVMHPPTAAKFQEDTAARQALEKKGVQFIERQPFTKFIRLIDHAAFLISDGGSNQEEAHYLGVPCLLLRERSERREGLGDNCLLSKLDSEQIQKFLKNPQAFRRTPQTDHHSPTDTILEAIARS